MRLISKYLTSQPGKLTTTIHILSNIRRIKGDQTMKFGQLVKYNMRKYNMKNHTQNVVEELFLDPFLKYQN